jgi:hypothetical protein
MMIPQYTNQQTQRLFSGNAGENNKIYLLRVDKIALTPGTGVRSGPTKKMTSQGSDIVMV